MPMEVGLKLMPIVSSHFSNAEGELFYNIVDEGDGVGLSVALVDFECCDAGGIVNGRVLIALDWPLVFVLGCQKLNINLNLMTRNLFLVPYGVNFAKPSTVRQTTDPVALEDAVDSSARDLYVMVAGQRP